MVLTSYEQIRSKASNFKTGKKKNLYFFQKLRSYLGIYKVGTLKAQDQDIISQKKVAAHLTYVACSTNIGNKDILYWFVSVIRGFLVLLEILWQSLSNFIIVAHLSFYKGLAGSALTFTQVGPNFTRGHDDFNLF